ncbi:MAG: metallophosphoesterase [Candidatus Bipolaricaulis sp.]|nr:metallophosphoesterase [Candidatus Bipolaricaulis sp.]MDD5265331.1 metallophosphoesterase [Candidatus Bipolaricaulis sp.]
MRKLAAIPVLLLTLLVIVGPFATSDSAEVVRIGIVTDVHVHDTNSPNEHKVMTGYEARLEAFVTAMVAWPADAVVSLGDLVNGVFVMGAELGDPARIPALLDRAVSLLRSFPGPIHYVLGNHDVYNLSKSQFLVGTASPGTYYSFDLGAYHVVILDAQFNKTGQDYEHVSWMVQGTIPAAELEWLRADLAATRKPTVVCVHQPLDVSFAMLAGGPPISNAPEVRAALVASGQVIAVFQGHTHDSTHTVMDGIHYITFAGMVDHDVPTPPSWAAVTLDPVARTIRIDGTSLQESVELTY